jgi:hypothetical protein
MEPIKQKPDGKIRLKQNKELENSKRLINIESPANNVQQKMPPEVKRFFKLLPKLGNPRVELELRLLLHTAPFCDMRRRRLCC